MIRLQHRLFPAVSTGKFSPEKGTNWVSNSGRLLALLLLLVVALPLTAQTSWKGTTSSSWFTSANWTNGVPSASKDAIIGDANFTGPNQPYIFWFANCKSLTIGAAVAATLTIDIGLTIAGDLTIGGNGTMTHSSGAVSVKGNWTKTGTYNATGSSSSVVFSGVSQGITGSTTFRTLTINSGSTTTLNTNISVTQNLTIGGVLHPNDPGYLVTLTGAAFTVSSGGILKVTAATLGGNYSINPTLSAGSIVDYASSSTGQTISVLGYSTLRISGTSSKTPAGNITLASGSASVGNLEVLSGTLSLGSSTINRGTTAAGGSITISNGAALKIGGTNSFPLNYATTNLATTSTVEYNGTNQTVSNKPYGNLTLSSASGSVTKTMPSTAMVIAQDLTSTVGSGTAVTFSAGANISVAGDITLGASTTFAGGVYTHTVSGNWNNNGTFTANTSTITLNGTSKTIGGSNATTFNNLTISGFGITSALPGISVNGNLSTSGAGSFTHATGGTLTMSGSSKIISGSGLTFHNLTISGTISTASSFLLTGNLSVGGTFNATSGTLEMSGSSKTISGAGTISFFGFRATGTVSTANNLTLKSELMGVGKLTATAGTITMTGTTTYAGAHDLYNVTLNGTRLQLGANSTFGLAGVFTLTAGTFDVSTTVPNTFAYNSTGSQTITTTTYNNLVFSGGGTKSAAGNLVANDLTINAGVTFNPGTHSHSLNGSWTNNGTFTASTSTINLIGASDVTINGATSTTFNALTINKANAATLVTLTTNTTAATVNMTAGELRTGSASLTITTTRSGNGIITGTITRTHAFSSGVAYAFESPYNTITLTSLVGSVTSITVVVNSSTADATPLDGGINRIYTVSLVNTGTYVATLRLHYLDAELNGNSEASLDLWRYTTSWGKSGKWANDATNNWVENTLLTNLAGKWTLSNDHTIAIWKGGTSSAWEAGSNWKSGATPGSGHNVQIGSEAFTNQPVISSAVTIRSLVFHSVQGATLTLNSGGSLVVEGTVNGNWTADASHTINIGAQSLTTGGDLLLGSGNAARVINVSASSGALTINGALSQSAGSTIAFTGAGSLSVKGNYSYSGGTFTAGTSTVAYTGTGSQTIGAVTYHHLSVNKASGTASIASPFTTNGNLTLSTGGALSVNADITVAGNVSIGSGVTVSESGATITLQGNWSNAGSFNPTTGTLAFTGSNNQTLSASTLNRVLLNKPAGGVTLTGNVVVNGHLTLTAGTLDLGSYTANRSILGGTLTLDNGSILKIAGGSNFPANYNTKVIAAGSTVEYYGTLSQSVVQVAYGNLTLRNGSSSKTLAGPITIAGDLLIDNATFNAGAHAITLQGNLTNNGTFTPATGTLVLDGSGKQVTGSINVNNLIVTGSYTSGPDTDLYINGNADVTGSYTTGENDVTILGDLKISGTYSTDGTSTYAGTRTQTVRLTGSFLSPQGTAVTVFDGSVAPILNSTSPPVFTSVHINNTSTIIPSVNWTVIGDFEVAPGCTFDGGSLTHTFYGPVINSGSMISSGVLQFSPAPPYTSLSSVSLDLGAESSFVSTGTVVFGGSRQLVLVGAPAAFHHVTVSNTHAAGITPDANWDIGGDLVVSAGANFHAGDSLTHTVRRNLEIAGTFTGGTSTVVLAPQDSINYISASGSLSFHHLVVNDSIVATSDFSIQGDLTNNSFLDLSDVTLTLSGDAPSVIGGTTNPMTIESLTINKTATDVSLGNDLTGLTSLVIENGTLANAGRTLTENNQGGTLQINAGAVLRLESTSTMPAFTTYALDPLSTVAYAGTDQVITPMAYGNVAVSNTGTKTLGSGSTQVHSLTIDGNLSQPIDAALTLTGDWINNGVFTAGSATVEFDGTATQHLGGTTVTNFANVLISNTASPGVRLQSDQNLSGVLTLAANAVLDADGTTDDKIFTLVSTADEPTSDASIAALPSGAQIDGNVTVQRYMTREGANNRRIYRYISSPVQNATVADLQNEIPVTGSFTGSSVCTGCGVTQSMFQYNESVITDSNNSGTADNNDGYIDFPANANTEILQPGLGYALYVRGNALATTAWNVRGPVNTANEESFSFPITFTSSGTVENDGWNLVGNPFPATIDWTAASGWTKTNVEQSIYIRNNGLDFPNYAVWNGLIGINGGSRYVAMGQAFWVKASGASPVLQANENVKAAGSQTSFFRVGENPITNLLRITLASGAVKDESAIHFREGATAGFDATADARKIPGSAFNLSSVLADGTKLAINSLSAFNCEATVRLAVDNMATTNAYRLEFNDVATFDPTIRITLIDKFTGTTFDVRGGGSYSFTVTTNTASYGTNRFELAFAAAAPSSNFVATAAAVCEGSEGSIQVANSEVGITYTVVKNGTVVAGPVDGTGQVLTIAVPSAKLQLYQNTMTVLATTAACHTEVSKSVDVFVDRIYSVKSVSYNDHCGPGSFEVTATGAAANGTYRWYTSLQNTEPIANQHQAVFTTPALTASTTYFVAVVNAAGCEGDRMAIAITVTQPLKTTFGLAYHDVCSGAEAHVTISDSQPDALYTFTDNNQAIVAAATGNGHDVPVSIAANALTDGGNMFTLTVSLAGCSQQLVKTLEIKSEAIYEVASVDDGAHCGAGRVTLAASGAPANGAYVWYSSATATQPLAKLTEPVFVTPNLMNSATFYVAIANGLGCEGARKPVVAEIVQFLSTAFTPVAQPVCEGESALIEVRESQSGVRYVAVRNGIKVAGPVTGNGATIALSIPGIFLSSGLNTIQVQGSAEGCTGAASKAVDVAPEKKYEVTTLTPATRCGSGSVTLTAAGAPANGQYNWYSSLTSADALDTHGPVLTTTLDASAVYYVAVVNALGCEGSRKPIAATVNPIPDVHISETGGVLSSNFDSGNQWFLNSEKITAATSRTWAANEQGVYRLEVTQNQCTGTDELEYVIMGIDRAREDDVQVYPNTTSDFINVRIWETENQNPVTLLTSTGQVLETRTTTLADGFRTCTFQVEQLPAGLYLVRFHGQKRTVYMKVIKN